MAEHLQFNIPKYSTIVQLEETTDGGNCYVAYHPELPDCLSQGTTPEEAEANLVEVTQMTIAHLVSSHLPIPEPMSLLPQSHTLLQVTSTCAAAGPCYSPVAQPNDRTATRDVMTVPSFSMSQL